MVNLIKKSTNDQKQDSINKHTTMAKVTSCERERWGDLGEWHWNMYTIMYGTSLQSRFDARYWMLGAGALGRPRVLVWGGRREEGSGWGTHVYLWWIHLKLSKILKSVTAYFLFTIISSCLRIRLNTSQAVSRYLFDNWQKILIEMIYTRWIFGFLNWIYIQIKSSHIQITWLIIR